MSSKIQVLKIFTRCYSSRVNLKEILSDLIPQEQEKIKKFRKDHGHKKVGDVTVNMVYGGMRGIKALLCETSSLDPEKGIRFRGYSIPELQEKLPKAPESDQPLPEGIFWLMLTSEIPNKDQVNWLSQQWAQRANIPEYVQKLLNNFPKSLHPMAQLSCAVTALHNDSHFSKAYLKGIKKHEYWKFVYEDAMDLIAKITVIAAIIYRNLYKGGAPKNLHETIDPRKDWAHNFTSMMSYPSFDMTELIRLYLTLHCDHEGGNVSSHATHLVGSALGDCYLSYAAGINGLAGPLHGLANQEVLMWLKKCHHELGDSITKEQLADYIKATLTSGKVIPGYGHAVLRSTDPRYLCFREFAFKHFPEDPLFKLCSMCFEVVPQVLQAMAKASNPWPNVDAHSGVLLQYYGLRELEFYTVVFAVSRCLGVLASVVWHRGLGLPIERPKSVTSHELQEVLQAMAKASNPWPNVDAHSGVLLQYYGVRELEFYTVMFAVSRCLGVLASVVWHRGLGLPIERPKSVTSHELLEVLQAMAKASNPWPNVDAHSGVLLQYYGLRELEFYTVMFAVSRCLGVLASVVWHRGLGLPIERPKSVTSHELQEVLQAMAKASNPWPNVDAHSGVLLQYYGVRELEFYTVMFAVSRCLGVLASVVWHRGLGLPIERPKSVTSHELLEVLQAMAKASNPWPNVDAHSGVLLQYYGLRELEFYTVMFAVSRCLGVLASVVWHRGLGLPIERPKSVTSQELQEVLQAMAKASNPWPNVDAHSGVLLQYYGLRELEFYTVMFAVSRCLGVLASVVWHRGLGLPIERPKSVTSQELQEVRGRQ